MSLPNAIGLGTVSGLNLNLINPYTTSSGNTYYFVDKGGDGSPDTRATVTARETAGLFPAYFDTVTHDELDTLFNAGSDTTDSLDTRQIIVGNYELVLPSLSELQAMRADVVSTGSGQVITEGQFPNNGAALWLARYRCGYFLDGNFCRK